MNNDLKEKRIEMKENQVSSFELKQPPVICILTATSDSAMKTFLQASKNLFTEKKIICSMRSAIELATKSKPPLIKAPTPDIMNVPGDLVSLVINNWLVTQLRKPPPKANQTKKVPPKKNIKGAAPPVAEPPPLPEVEIPGPYFVFLTDFPKYAEQLNSLFMTPTRVVCFLQIDGSSPEDGTKTQRSGTPNSATSNIDWRAHFEDQIPFISIHVGTQVSIEEQTKQAFDQINSYYNAFLQFKEDYQDIRFISIPKYLEEQTQIHQVAPDKTISKKDQPASKSPQSVAPPPPSKPIEKNRALKMAYRKAIFGQLDDYISNVQYKLKALQYVNMSQLLPPYPIPAHLQNILQKTPDPRAPEIFTMRQLSYHSKIPYENIFNVMMMKEFEQMVGYSVGERRHFESLSQNILGNVFGELFYQYSDFKYTEFGGKLLLAFYHKLPNFEPLEPKNDFQSNPITPITDSKQESTANNSSQNLLQNSSNNTRPTTASSTSTTQSSSQNLTPNIQPNTQQNSTPISEEANENAINGCLPITVKTEEYKLPLYEGFGKWIRQHELPSSEIIDPEPSDKHDISISTGHIDMFRGVSDPFSRSSITRYFDESGFRVESYPTSISGGLIQNLDFISYFGDISFSYHMSQKQLPPLPEEEEEDNIDTMLNIRGHLSSNPNVDLLFEHDSEKVSFSIISGKSRTEFDVIGSKAILYGAKGESRRFITFSGDIIKFTPTPIIYKNDGSIQKMVLNKVTVEAPPPEPEPEPEIKPTAKNSKNNKNDNNSKNDPDSQADFDKHPQMIEVTVKEWTMIDAVGRAFIKQDGKWYREPSKDTTTETIETYFTSRKVTNRSDGVSFIEDDDDSLIVFPDQTTWSRKDCAFSHPDLPKVVIKEKGITINGNGYSATFNDERDCTVETTKQDCKVSFKQESRHLIIQFGINNTAMTMVDLFTGVIAHVGQRRCVYYLNEEWKWKIGRQLCSKKEFIQHFTDGDFAERLKPIDGMEIDEVEEIFRKGHGPRLFVVDALYPQKKNNSNLLIKDKYQQDQIIRDIFGEIINQRQIEVEEILSPSDFQLFVENSSNRETKKTNSNVTLWYDGKPKCYREMRIGTKISNEERNKIMEGFEKERENEKREQEIRQSISEPKWKELEQQQNKEELDVLETLKKYNVFPSNNGPNEEEERNKQNFIEEEEFYERGEEESIDFEEEEN